MRIFLLVVLLILIAPTTRAIQTKQDSNVVVLRVAQILDVQKGIYLKDAAIWIEGERIKSVGRTADIMKQVPTSARLIYLNNATVLPGLIDCHTHLLARVSDGDNTYSLNLLTKSEAYRAIEGVANARATLEAGFTTVRDVENEGSGYADIALRDAINEGLVLGPRMQVATRGIAAVGQYHPFGITPNLSNFPTGAQMISGLEEARRAVREQIGHGADLIKVYADWHYPTLSVAEMRVIVEEAHRAKRKVAAHATTIEGIHNAIRAGVDSIEHGTHIDKTSLVLMKLKGIYLVPTVSSMDAKVAKAPEKWESGDKLALLKAKHQGMINAKQIGVKIASGSDSSSADRHGKNAKELQSLISRGIDPLESIRAATIQAAALMGLSNEIGTIEPGKYADLIAIQGDPIHDIALLQDVKFVMKGGHIIKNEFNS